MQQVTIISLAVFIMSSQGSERLSARSHDCACIHTGCAGSGGPARFLPCEHVWSEAEALECAEQVEALVLGLALRINDLGQLTREWHSPPDRVQVVRVLRVLLTVEIQRKCVSTHTSVRAVNKTKKCSFFIICIWSILNESFMALLKVNNVSFISYVCNWDFTDFLEFRMR